jgi:hypothetical protein
MNVNYEKAIGVVGTLIKKGEGLWGLLCLFAHDTRGVDANGKDLKMDGETLKAVFTSNEKVASKDMRTDMNKNSTYRVAKGILIAAVEADLSLVDSDGKPRGKTDLENELKDLKEKKSPLEKFQSAIASAAKQVDKLDPADLPTAYLLAKQVADDLAALIGTGS